MKIIVAGCNGQLGRAVAKELRKYKSYEIIGCNSNTLDISELESVMAKVREVRPYAIINCAAYTKVDDSETNMDRAVAVNAIGARNLAIASAEHHAKLIHVSTDYVFDGQKKSPYTEFDIPNPQGVYAKTKYEGEKFVEKFADKYFIFRTSGLYGEGHNFVRTMLEKAKKGKEISVVNDQITTPTSAIELAKCICSMLSTDNYGIFHATCEGACSWADFAKEIFTIMNIPIKIVEIDSATYGSNVERPNYSVLENYMLKLTHGYIFPEWQLALRDYLGVQKQRNHPSFLDRSR